MEIVLSPIPTLNDQDAATRGRWLTESWGLRTTAGFERRYPCRGKLG